MEIYQTLKSLLNLIQRISPEQSEEELSKIFVEFLTENFRGFKCCIRLIEPREGRLIGAYANGILNPEMREKLFITPDSFESGEIPHLILSSIPPSVEILDSPRPIFRYSTDACVFSLYSGDELMGFVHMESSKEISMSSDARLFLFVTTGFFSTIMSNHLSLKRLMYLQDYTSKLIEYANAPILIIGSDRKIKLFNKTMEALIGYSREDLLGSDFLNLVRGEDRQRVQTLILNILQGKSKSGFEINIPRRGDEQFVPMVLNVAPVIDSDGELKDIIIIGQDLTEIRRLQNQMLHSERLATIGQLSAGVVHEINNPLTSISVYSDYLLKKYERGGMEEGDLRRLKRIVMAADRILKFTKELMSFARPVSDEPSLVDLRETINTALGFCEHVINRCSIRVVKDFPEELPPVYGIKEQLQQVFVNVFTNACHAMEEVGGELKIRIVDKKDGSVLTEVSDDGVGMPPDVLQKVFDPFFTTKADGEGTGLGMSIVKNIIDRHQGEVKVTSAVGKGTTISILLYTLE